MKAKEYEVTFSCGHTEVKKLSKYEYDSKLKWFVEKGLCKACYKAQQDKKLAEAISNDLVRVVTMLYKDYKYSGYRAVEGSYNSEDKTIKVYVGKNERVPGEISEIETLSEQDQKQEEIEYMAEQSATKLFLDIASPKTKWEIESKKNAINEIVVVMKANLIIPYKVFKSLNYSEMHINKGAYNAINKTIEVNVEYQTFTLERDKINRNNSIDFIEERIFRRESDRLAFETLKKY